MRGVDKPTVRVIALIVLLIVSAAALRGYLPPQEHAAHTEQSGAGKAAQTFVVLALVGSLAVVALAIVARLRDPRAAAPEAGQLSDLLGTGGIRPSWRVVLIGLGVIVAWLLLTIILIELWVPQEAVSPGTTPATTAPSAGKPSTPRPPQRPPNHHGDMLGILVAASVVMLLLMVAGSVVTARRRRRAAIPVTAAVADPAQPMPQPPPESLARAAERGLAAMADLGRDPREAIIACYAAMERELANVPGAAPQEFDTPSEVLARAVHQHALRADNAAQLVTLFTEARFSPHVMTEGHRDDAVRVLRLVRDELGARAPLGSPA